MQTEAIIKHIGHRPVYRVEPHWTAGTSDSRAQETAVHGAPLIEQEARNRFISGRDELQQSECRF